MSMRKYEHEFWDETVRRENCDRFCANINLCKEDKVLTNVKIICRDSQVFDCHTLILAAVSDYFARIFENIDVGDPFLHAVLVDVDGAEFKYVMQFAYNGEVQIDDENVLNFLRVSHTFEIKTLEDWCVRYLTERNIPTNHAVELFAFARTAHKTALEYRLARFILNNLREVANGGAGLQQMNLEEMRTLLTHWRPSSQNREHDLLIVLSHWISHSRVDQHPGKEALLTEFSNNLQLEHFEKASVRQSLQATSNMNLGAEIPSNQSESSLYMYMRKPSSGVCSLFRYSKISKEKITVECTPLSIPVQMEMKTVAVNDQLYLYSFDAKCGNNRSQFSFSRHSSASLSDKVSLRTPEEVFPRSPPSKTFSRSDFNSLNVCSDPIGQRIYLSHAFHEASSRGNLFSYICESDRWLPIFDDHDADFYSGMVVRSCSDSRLYMTRFAQELLQVYAYDYRAGKCEVLPSLPKATSEQNNRFCCHKEKLYFAHDQITNGGSCRRRVGLVVYDPVAAGWYEITLNPTYVPINRDVRVISFDNKLWMFGKNSKCASDSIYYYQTFDPFTQGWDEGPTWYDAERWSVLDMTVFKSLYLARMSE